MSTSSEKGKALENYIAKTLRKKLGARVKRDGKSGAGSHQKMDIVDYFQDTPFDIEAKNHKTLKIREWLKQATESNTNVSRIPTVVFEIEDMGTFAAVPFESLVDLAAEIQQQKAEIDLLRAPVVTQGSELAEKATAIKSSSNVSTCRAGHIVSPGSSKCLAKGCPYSSSYKAKKVKR